MDEDRGAKNIFEDATTWKSNVKAPTSLQYYGMFCSSKLLVLCDVNNLKLCTWLASIVGSVGFLFSNDSFDRLLNRYALLTVHERVFQKFEHT